MPTNKKVDWDTFQKKLLKVLEDGLKGIHTEIKGLSESLKVVAVNNSVHRAGDPRTPKPQKPTVTKQKQEPLGDYHVVEQPKGSEMLDFDAENLEWEQQKSSKGTVYERHPFRGNEPDYQNKDYVNLKETVTRFMEASGKRYYHEGGYSYTVWDGKVIARFPNNNGKGRRR